MAMSSHLAKLPEAIPKPHYSIVLLTINKLSFLSEMASLGVYVWLLIASLVMHQEATSLFPSLLNLIKLLYCRYLCHLPFSLYLRVKLNKTLSFSICLSKHSPIFYTLVWWKTRMAKGRHEYSFEILKCTVNSNRKSEGNKVKEVLEDTETTTLFFKTMA